MPEPLRQRGRPRTFDKKAALDVAVALFWRHGYEGTSIADLTAAMGVTPPTLYAAFGSKEQLYRQVLARYVERHGSRERLEAFEREPSAYRAIEGYLRAFAEQLANPSVPAGCMVSTATLVHAQENKPAAEATAALRATTLKRLEARFEAARHDGQLPADVDPAALARFYAAIAQGMSVQSHDGASAAALNGLVDIALHAWPGARPDESRPRG